MGTLYIVATPIGNLDDITLRAIKTLQNVDAIACEDTRKTGLLLSRILPPPAKSDLAPAGGSNTANNPINKPRLISYYEQNELQRIPEIINTLRNGLNIALVSDAGTPTVSDPGFKLIRECIKEGIKVESIPGPSSVISAIVSSGLPTDKFLFLGYVPKKEGKRKKILNELQCFKTLKQIHPTIIFFESPYRLLKTLEDMKEVLGDIDIVICRELTKIHEEIRREKISTSIDHFKKIAPKGEFVILFNLNNKNG